MWAGLRNHELTLYGLIYSGWRISLSGMLPDYILVYA